MAHGTMPSMSGERARQLANVPVQQLEHKLLAVLADSAVDVPDAAQPAAGEVREAAAPPAP